MKTRLPAKPIVSTAENGAENRFSLRDTRDLAKAITVSIIAIASILTVLIQPFL